MFIQEISARSTGMNSRNTTKMVQHKLVSFATVIALWTLLSGNTYKTNVMPFWPLCREKEAIVSKMFLPGHRAGVFIWENFRPGCRDVARKNRDLGNRAIRASHMNKSIPFAKKRVASRDLGNRASPVDRAQKKRPPQRHLTLQIMKCNSRS